MIFGINTIRDISKLSQISLAQRLVELRITISKYLSWYLGQIMISLLIMLLPIQIGYPKEKILSVCVSSFFPFFGQVTRKILTSGSGYDKEGSG